MPKIEAATVAEHRNRQHRALLDAAQRVLLCDGVKAVTPGNVGRSVGLQRSSVYKYFASGADLLAELVEESFASWADDIASAVGSETTPSERIDAYARTTLELAAAGRHHIATALAGVDLGSNCRARIAELHRGLTAPLQAALADRGDEHPEITAALIQGVLDGTIRLLDSGRPAEDVTPPALAFLRAAESQTG
jgi:AcrR family transcriptional regulator